MRCFLLLTTFVASALLVVPSLAVPFDEVAQDVAVPRSVEADALVSGNVERNEEQVAHADVADILYTRDITEAKVLDARDPKKKKHRKSKKVKKLVKTKVPKAKRNSDVAEADAAVLEGDAEAAEDADSSESFDARALRKKAKKPKKVKGKKPKAEKPKKLGKPKKGSKPKKAEVPKDVKKTTI